VDGGKGKERVLNRDERGWKGRTWRGREGWEEEGE